MSKRVILPFLLVSLAPASAWAATIEIGPSANLGAEIAKLSPGDELVLQGGTYTLTSKLTIDVSGTEAQPIVIRAKDGEVPHITRDASQNVINIEHAEYIVLRGLEVSEGSHGIRMMDASFITIEDCHIHDTGDVAISANVSGYQYEGLKILRNHIHHTNNTGEGMYLGCNDDGCQMFNSLIEGNYVHDTNQASVVQGDGIEIKQGSYANIVRDNVIHGTNYPCILVYGTAGKAQNLIERNAMWDCGDHGIQAEADAIIRNNLVLGAAADGIRNQNHQQQSVEDLVIVHNTVINSGDAIRSDSIAGSVLIANNAVYSQNGNAIRASGDLTMLTVAGNVGMGGLQGVSGGFDASGDITADFVNAAFGASALDVFPKAGSKLIGAGDVQHVVDDDFNGTARGGIADVGAYKYDAAGNPGWPVGPGFKTPTGSAGSGGGSGAAGSSGSGGSGGGTGGGAGSTGSGGSGATGSGGAAGSAGSSGGSSDDDGGCGCRAAGQNSQQNSIVMLAFSALLLLRRRR